MQSGLKYNRIHPEFLRLNQINVGLRWESVQASQTSHLISHSQAPCAAREAMKESSEPKTRTGSRVASLRINRLNAIRGA